MKNNSQTKHVPDKDAKPKPKKHSKGDKKVSRKAMETLHNDLLKEAGSGLENLFLATVVSLFLHI